MAALTTVFSQLSNLCRLLTKQTTALMDWKITVFFLFFFNPFQLIGPSSWLRNKGEAGSGVFTCFENLTEAGQSRSGTSSWVRTWKPTREIREIEKHFQTDSNCSLRQIWSCDLYPTPKEKGNTEWYINICLPKVFEAWKVTSFNYLGSVITHEGSKPEILSRITQTTAALTRLKPVWIDKRISLSSKIRLMHSLVTTIFLYACESWTLTAELQRRIQAMEMRCYHKILHIS